MNIVLLPETQELGGDIKIINTRQVAHINTVLKAAAGERLKIGVKNQQLGAATIKHLDEHCCILTDVVLDKAPPPKLNLTMILALPRPKVLRRLILDMAAMGVAHIVLVNSYRTDKSYWGSPLLERLDEFVYEGLEQGVDTVPPKITLAKRFKPFVQDELPILMHNKRAVVAHPYGQMLFGQFVAAQGLPEVVVVGAEGGFIDYEIALLGSVGVQAVSLGTRILRTESAVNAIVGRFLH